MSTGSYVEVTGGESQPGKDDPPFKRACNARVMATRAIVVWLYTLT